ncbi:hypothetical protein ACFYZH_18915 [Streptomyces abikoensis]|uniref:hypothetical protein n=1 Tax=Streptomyces abikoensis TaxID=97398 RepID=UPI00368D6CF6
MVTEAWRRAATGERSQAREAIRSALAMAEWDARVVAAILALAGDAVAGTAQCGAALILRGVMRL